ncbi:MAG TPA: alkaline phosphatase family protein [Candidatus Binatia bacterium]|nr:alkaline phosphatase family protein [Candidatus Binatia bacterium]
MKRPVLALICLFVLVVWANRSHALPPRYDHIVIVVEENRTPTEIIGDRANAPYINTLADGGVKIGAIFAEVHPSQPNYMHLFSGDHQGIVDDNLPPNFSTTPTATYPFRTPNIGAELIAAGFTFAGYSEELESAGTSDWADYDPHSATNPGIYYRRKHVPWANWIAKVSPIPANQLSTNVNLCFTNFPGDYKNLPTVSFVIPNQLHDMHDGSRKQGDDWLRDNLDRYAQWAKTNNSLLIVTWDEDDYNSVNQIPTILYGAGLRDGTSIGGTWTHHNILRTIEDMYGTAHAGNAASVRPIIGPFTNDPPLTVRSFRQGAASGYSGAIDTQILAETPSTTTYGTNQELTADLDTSTAAGNQVAQVLMRFDSIIGTGLSQIPSNSIIHSAKLMIYTPLTPAGAVDDYDSDDIFRIHRMLVNWNNSSTWNTLNGGVNTDNIEAASAATSWLMPDVESAPQIFDVTSDIELFRTGTTNLGWMIRASSTVNGWTMRSSDAIDATQRPTLEVVYTAFFTPYETWIRSTGLSGVSAQPMTDFEHDGLPNIAEYAYNLNPRNASDNRRLPPNGTSGTPAPYYVQESGGVLEVEFLRRITATDLTYRAQFSSDLVTWSDGLPAVVTPMNATFERVRVRDTASGGTRGFVKVVLTLQP